MNKTCLWAALMLHFSAAIQAKVVNGTVTTDSEEPLADVVVTDGFGFAVTDATGHFTLDTHDEAHFVYAITPSGYVANCQSGTPCFYKAVEEKTFDFKFTRWGNPEGSYTFFAIGDTQPRDSVSFRRLQNEAMKDLKETGEMYINEKNTPVFGIILGDIVSDRLDFFPGIKEELRKLGYPVYPVIGNHDHDKSVYEDDGAAHVYRTYFGPTYYAFNAGRDHFIALDGILYKGNRKYNVGISQQQLDWVKEYLTYIPAGAHIYLCMHTPTHNIYNEGYKFVNRDALLALFADYKVDILSGHTHIQGNLPISPNIRQYNTACIGGQIWLWDSHFSKDGTPEGYQVFDVTPRGTTNYYKASGYPKDYQLKIFPLGTVEGHEKELCVKCWNYDERWTIEWYEDGKSRGRLQKIETPVHDPDYTNYLNREYLKGRGRVAAGKQPLNSKIFFSVTPSEKAREIKVVATDPYGRAYSQTLEL